MGRMAMAVLPRTRGEGVGYRLGRGVDLRRRMLPPDRARALAMATPMARQWLDPALSVGDAMSV